MSSELKFDNWQDTSGNTVGTILQVKQIVYTDTWTQTTANGTTWYSTPLAVSITPRATTSKVLIMVTLHAGTGYWEIQGRVLRGSTPIGLGTPRGSRTACGFAHHKYDNTYDYYNVFPMQYTYLDSPATTSNTQYVVQLNSYSTYTLHLNRSNSYQNSADQMGVPVSTLTLMEIAA